MMLLGAQLKNSLNPSVLIPTGIKLHGYINY